MDTNLQVLTSFKSNIDSQVIGLQAQSVALKIAIDLETNGYQSDQSTIDAAVAAQVGDIQTENAQLATDKQTLQTTIDGLNTTIANMTAVFAGLGYNPDGTPITPSE
jgi:hypothetical protein